MAINNKHKVVQNFLAAHLTARGDEFFQDDPTVMGFNILFSFNDTPSEFPSTTHSPLFNEQRGRDSAINYLKAIGEPERAESLKEFKNRLQTLSQKFPYYFQELSGLNELNAPITNSGFRMNERKITINTLESIDLKVASIINAYMKAVVDYEYMREIVPENLLDFSMVIYVHEIRDFRIFVDELYGDKSPKFEVIDKNLIIHRYILRRCKFDFTDSNPWMESIDNKGGEPSTNRISIIPGYMEEDHNLRFMDMFTPKTDTTKLKPRGMTPEIGSDLVAKQPSGERLDGVTSLDKENIGTLLRDVAVARTEQAKTLVEDFVQKEAKFFRTKLDPGTLAARGVNALFDEVNDRLNAFVLGNVFSKYKKFRNVDVFSTLREYVEEKINGGDPDDEEPSWRNTIGENPEPTIVDNLGKANLKVVPIDQTALFLDNIDGFDQAPISTVLDRITAGSLGNVFR